MMAGAWVHGGDVELALDRQAMKLLQKNVKRLGNEAAAKIAASASKKGLKVILKAARANAEKIQRTGLLALSLDIVQKKYKRTGTIFNAIGPRHGFKDPISGENPANIAHLVELGTDPHTIAPKGQAGALKIKRGHGPTRHVKGEIHHPGAKAKPFMRPAYDAKGKEAMRVTADTFDKGVAKAIKKLSKK